MKRILSVLLCLALVIGFIPVFTMPTQAAETKTFEKVTSEPTDWTGEYLIVYEAGNVAFNGALSSLDAVSNTVAVTISNDTIAYTDTLGKSTFTIAKSGSNYLVKSKSGYNIGQTSDANGLASNTSTTYNHTISFNSDKSVNLISGGAYLRYNAASNQNRFRYYKSSSYTNQKAICLYKLVESTSGGETPSCDHADSKLSWKNDETQHWQECSCGDYTTTPADHDFTNSDTCECGYVKPTVSEAPTYKLVTDASTLKAGDKIVIVATDYDVALSTEQKTNNRGQATVEKNVDDKTVTFDDDVQILTLEAGTVDGTFAFNTGSGYLYAASDSSNYLRTETTLSANSSWTIAIAADGTATIVAQGTNTRNTMRYNQISSLFACYAAENSQKDICIYKLVVPAFDSASLVLQNNLAVQFNVPVALFDNTGFSEPYAVFNFDGKDYTVTEKTETTDSEGTAVYAFTFANIAPHKVGETITYTLKSTYDGQEVSSESGTYSVLTYCQNKLTATDSSDKLKTLVSDLLNYCAAVQTSLGETPLDTSAIEGFAPTTDDVTLTSCTAVTEGKENPAAVWDSVTLVLKDNVTVRFFFKAQSIDGLTVKIDGAKSATISEIKQEGEYYYVDFTGLLATDMRKQITATVYSGDTAVSETVTYSVESYAAKYQNVEANGMGALVKAMMKYGDSAANY